MTYNVELAMPDAAPDQLYSDWDLKNTFVISGPLPWAKRRWPNTKGRTMGRRQARVWVAQTYGRFEELRHARKWAFRVIKPGAPGGRYTPPDGFPENDQYGEKVVLSVTPVGPRQPS